MGYSSNQTQLGAQRENPEWFRQAPGRGTDTYTDTCHDDVIDDDVLFMISLMTVFEFA